jgi:hypothetical protein
MMPAPLQLDFVSTARRASFAGLLTLAVGAAAAGWTVFDYRDLSLQSTLLEMQVDAATPRTQRTRTAVPADTHAIEEATEAVAELSLPWSQLLNDLEVAGQAKAKDVALLSIEPDREKRRVRIAAEARTLPAALEFVETLQKAGALKYPLLDNHKVRTDQSERPVYFELTAEWSLSE